MNNETVGPDSTKKNVLICDTEPVAVEGMKWLIESSGDLRFAGSVPTLDAVYGLLDPEAAKAIADSLAASQLSASKLDAPAMEGLMTTILATGELENESSMEFAEPEPGLAEKVDTEILAMAACAGEIDATGTPAIWADAVVVPEPAVVSESASEASPISFVPMAFGSISFGSISEPIDAVVIDKGLGLARVMDLLQKLTSTSHPTPVVVWGAAINEAEALRLLQAGARGILRRTSEPGTLLTCLRAVTSGGTWMEDGIFGSTEKLFNPRRSQLTHREREVVVLVEKGLRNRDIAKMLGIQTGTVKIHLKHIFEKTGVRGRYGLAFTGLQNKGSIALTAPPQFAA